MSSYESFDDDLKAVRFKSKRNVSLGLRLSGALLSVLLCCSFTWTLGFEGLASDHPSPLGHRHCAFLLINVIVLLVYRLPPDSSNTKNDAAVEPDQHVSFSSSASAASSRSNATVCECKQLVVSEVPAIPSEEDALQNKQTVVCKDVEYSPIEGNHRVHELTMIVANDCAAAEVQEEENHYRRTRSELNAREKTSHGRQFRRSETESRRQPVVADCRSAARKSMEDMNSEEFRYTVESFIATTKKSLREENDALLSEGPNEADGHHFCVF